jgi:hypothetical protein
MKAKNRTTTPMAIARMDDGLAFSGTSYHSFGTRAKTGAVRMTHPDKA